MMHGLLFLFQLPLYKFILPSMKHDNGDCTSQLPFRVNNFVHNHSRKYCNVCVRLLLKPLHCTTKWRFTPTKCDMYYYKQELD